MPKKKQTEGGGMQIMKIEQDWGEEKKNTILDFDKDNERGIDLDLVIDFLLNTHENHYFQYFTNLNPKKHASSFQQLTPILSLPKKKSGTRD